MSNKVIKPINKGFKGPTKSSSRLKDPKSSNRPCSLRIFNP